MATKKSVPDKFYLLLRDDVWDEVHPTLEEAKDSAEDCDTILEVTGVWDVTSMLNLRKASLSEYT